jgi:putative nucleotidyltransferase with HDIG domain
MPRIGYRVWQFWRTLWDRPSISDLAAARKLLSPELFNLFQQMQLAEQAHALRVFSLVKAGGHHEQALLEAALLHDIGKSRFRLSAWERSWIVLGNALFPDRIKAWGNGQPVGWRRSFVVSERHPEWGAEMAAAAGAGELTVKLVREHQTASPDGFSTEEADLLAVLQQADNQS